MSHTSPDDFIYRDDMSADEIPVERVDLRNLGLPASNRPAEYTRVLSALYDLFPPASRLLLGLIFARDVFGEDAPGGWTKLGRGLTRRFGLTDRCVRRRAVAALQRQGVVDVRRRKGGTTHLQLKDPPVPGAQRQTGPSEPSGKS
ncbi:MAG TPA: hypothetical protein DIU07_14095 [Rhodobacteraceae bacterium]|nr:hypothetical protein [Paracoccaceae bacterium]